MIEYLKVKEIRYDRSFYHPGEAVSVTVDLESGVEQPVSAHLSITVSHATKHVLSLEEPFELIGETQSLNLEFQPPPEAPRGYGLDVCVDVGDKYGQACLTSAFDVLDNWTDTPRYGFLTDFEPGRLDFKKLMDSLLRYHLNGLQFYDWMYRHEQFLTDQEPYRDPLGRQLSRATVEALIEAVHTAGIAAMPYTAIYAASVPFYHKHPDWALFKANGEPYLLGENFLVYMDPRPGSQWSQHLLDQFTQILTQTAFDGIHLDQYGDPKEGYDAQGMRFELAEPLAGMINATKEVVQAHRLQGSVVFNAVTNWPVETVAPAEQDLVYIEVWPPYIWFEDLHALIVNAQQLGDGKPVVLAAYISPKHEVNVRLADAVIFASGGGHIELGEEDGMLADPYFPRYEPVSPALTDILRRYYEFTIRYQDLIGPRCRDATVAYRGRIEVNGFSTSASQMTDKVWPIVRESPGFTAISLINLVGLDSPEWNKPLEAAPRPLGTTQVWIEEVPKSPAAVWIASPDWEDISLRKIPFSFGDGGLTLEIPSLQYWDLILLDWGS
jgi:dextranase